MYVLERRYKRSCERASYVDRCDLPGYLVTCARPGYTWDVAKLLYGVRVFINGTKADLRTLSI